MDKAKILRLCNEIEDIATEIQERTMKYSYFMAQTIINKVLVIAAEINEPPETNGDHIRKMADEELAEMVSMQICRIVKPDGKDCPKGFYFGKCDKCVISWLKQEVEKGDER